MRKIATLFVLVTLSMTITACGVKGPLYFPQTDNSPSQPH